MYTFWRGHAGGDCSHWREDGCYTETRAGRGGGGCGGGRGGGGRVLNKTEAMLHFIWDYTILRGL